jgi:hypothetical protein
VGHCRENDFDLPRTSDIDDGFNVTSKYPELTRIQRTLRLFPADLRGGFYENLLRIWVQVKLQRPVGNAYAEDVSINNPRRLTLEQEVLGSALGDCVAIVDSTTGFADPWTRRRF